MEQVELPWREPRDGMPEKTGNYVYERVECLVIKTHGKMEILFWNCEVECWDNEDDYECDKEQVSFFIPTSELKMPWP